MDNSLPAATTQALMLNHFTPLANLSQIITAGGRLIGIGDSLGDGGVSIPKRGLYASREGFHAVRINSGPEFDSLSVGNNGIWFAHTRYPGGGYFGTWRYSTDLFNALRGPNSDAGISVAFGNGLYLSLLSDGPYAGVSSSVDGIAWPRASAPISGSKLIFGNGRFLSYDTSVRMKSTDNGLSWVPVSGNEYGVWSLTFASGKFAAVSWGKKAMQFSSDGENWKTVRVPAESSMCGIAYGEAGITSVPPVGRWVAVGDKGQIFISENDSEAASAKKLTINPAVQLRWFGETGVTYRIQSSTNMAGWEDEGDLIQGAGAEIVISEPAVSPVRFFRIVPQ
jgi:hypothetical protein